MAVQNDLDVCRRPLWRDMLKPKSQSIPGEIGHQWPFVSPIAVAAHHCYFRPDRAQLIDYLRRTNIAQVPDFVRLTGKIDNLLRQFVVGVGQDENAQPFRRNIGGLEWWSDVEILTQPAAPPILHYSRCVHSNAP